MTTRNDPLYLHEEVLLLALRPVLRDWRRRGFGLPPLDGHAEHDNHDGNLDAAGWADNLVTFAVGANMPNRR